MTSLNPVMQTAIDSGLRFACSTVPLLLVGERGVGKQWLAHQIHAIGNRSSAPWLSLHCASIDPKVLANHIQSASGGTLFLEDIDQASLAVQADLVTLLEAAKMFDEIEGCVPKATPRLIASTTCTQPELISRGFLRQDLYFLLSPVTLYLPPLRERIEDIPDLADHFCFEAARLFTNDSPIALPAEILEELLNYSWPGNLDQLQSCLRRALLNSDGPEITIDISAELVRELDLLQPCRSSEVERQSDRRQEDFKERIQVVNSTASFTSDLGELTRHLVSRGIKEADAAREPLHSHVVNRVEKELISQILKECEQVQTKAAQRLGINRNTLHKKVIEYDLNR